MIEEVMVGNDRELKCVVMGQDLHRYMENCEYSKALDLLQDTRTAIVEQKVKNWVH